MLQGRPYGPHWEQFLRRMDMQTLFKLSLQSSEIFRVVMGYVQGRIPESCHKDELRVGGPPDRLSKVPVEFFQTIFVCITVGDRIRLSRTSRKFRALFVRELQAVVTHTLRKFQLVHYEVWFIQSATLTLFSGPLVSHILDYCVAATHLEFYTPSAAQCSVLRFFELATVYVGTAGRYNRGMFQPIDDKTKVKDTISLGIATSLRTVKLLDDVVAGDVSTWTTMFLTCTLTVLEDLDDYTNQSYVLDVMKVDAMYKNMD
ncbi:hypothetical protein B0H13DRAFT_2323180 [Mycena leptocephala]|nr:hypothetical protein B0H13DRAFT_2323180 [Mycena leptocephala]